MSLVLGVIQASVRDNRAGEPVASWVRDVAAGHADVEVRAIDLHTFDLPIYHDATLPMMANKEYADERVTAWSQAIDACDAFVIVTPEYNHGIPGALKNAIDSLGPEFVGKVAGLVGYGADGGVRAVEQLRLVLANFSMVVVRGQVSLQLFGGDFTDGGFTPAERRAGEIKGVIDEVVAVAAKLKG